MKKIILNLAISLDGYIEGPNGEYDWCFTDQDYGFTEFFNSVDTIFYGRRSYELFGSFTPAENGSETEKTMFVKMQRMKKFVFSRTLKFIEGAELISDNVEEEVNKLKSANDGGKNIFLFGGASLITTFVNSDLVDEYILGIHPVILGAGKPLFIDINQKKNLRLTDSKVYDTGLIMLHYEPVR